MGVLCDALWFADGHECGVCYGVVQGLTGICLRMFEALFRILSEFVCFLSSLFMFFPSSFSFPITSLLSAACHCCYLHRSFWCLSFFFLIPTAGLLVWSMQRGFQWLWHSASEQLCLIIELVTLQPAFGMAFWRGGLKRFGMWIKNLPKNAVLVSYLWICGVEAPKEYYVISDLWSRGTKRTAAQIENTKRVRWKPCQGYLIKKAWPDLACCFSQDV